MSDINNVTKRNGELQPFDQFKFQRFLNFGCKDLPVDSLDIEIEMLPELVEGISTKQITQLAIRSAVSLMTEEKPEYTFAAARFVNIDLRQQVYGSFTPWSWKQQIETGIAAGMYDHVLRTAYTDAELETINSFIDHERDWNFTFGGIEQTRSKYLLRNRVTKQMFETPQMMYMRICASLLSIIKDPAERLAMIKECYDYTSLWYFSLPTPIMCGAGTPTRQFSSCVGIKIDDNLDSIIEGGGHIVRYAAKRAGIGFDIGGLRGVDAGIRGGELVSTGLIPFLKKLKGDLKSCAQGGVRGASATAYFPIWHWEFPELIVLKNNKGTEENRERQLDYGVATNGYMLQKAVEDGFIWLFSPEQVPDLYMAFYQDQDLFAHLYDKYSRQRKLPNGDTLRKKKLKAKDIKKAFATERSDTGRIYPIFIDNINYQGPFDRFLDPIFHSNLCAEIVQPSSAFTTREDEAGRIFLCTLASMNWGKFDDPKDMRGACYAANYLLNCLLDFQDYPTVQSQLSTREFRALGIGILNKAYFLAKRGMKYGTPESLAEVKKYMEHQTYYLTEASVEWARKYGACTKSATTCYGKGQFSWERRKPGVDLLTDFTPDASLDWEGLRANMKQYGIANAVNQAQAPVETSAQPMGATNGIEPPQELISQKVSKDGVMKHVVPELVRLKDVYETKWTMGIDGCSRYLKSAAVMQAFMDQSISTNTFYNPLNYPKGRLPFRVVFKDMVDFYNAGGKTLYYQVNYDGDAASQKKEVVSKGVTPAAEDDCESCKI